MKHAEEMIAEKRDFSVLIESKEHLFFLAKNLLKSLREEGIYDAFIEVFYDKETDIFHEGPVYVFYEEYESEWTLYDFPVKEHTKCIYPYTSCAEHIRTQESNHTKTLN